MKTGFKQRQSLQISRYKTIGNCVYMHMVELTRVKVERDYLFKLVQCIYNKYIYDIPISLCSLDVKVSTVQYLQTNILNDIVCRT